MVAKINERFKPDPSFKKLQYLYLLILLLFLLPLAVTIIMLIAFFTPEFAVILTFFFLAIYLLILSPSIIWINLYYLSLFYTFTEDEIIVERGVWWKHRNIVPYNRITNVDIRQGPLSRLLGLWAIHVQTAGYHVAPQGYGVSEAILQGIKNVEETKSFILSMVRRLKPVSVEAGVETVSSKLDEQILAELKKIREALESKN